MKAKVVNILTLALLIVSIGVVGTIWLLRDYRNLPSPVLVQESIQIAQPFDMNEREVIAPPPLAS